MHDELLAELQLIVYFYFYCAPKAAETFYWQMLKLFDVILGQLLF